MADHDRDRDYQQNRSYYQRGYRPQDSKTYKHHDAENQNTQPFKQKTKKYQEEWTNRPRERDHAWGWERDRRSRSPTRLENRQEIGRLSPTPYEPAYRTDWRKRARDRDEDIVEAQSVKDRREEDQPGVTMRAKLEAQIAALTTGELSFEIDLLIHSAKEEAGIGVHPARKVMEKRMGDNDGGEMDVEYSQLGPYDNLESSDEVYGRLLPTR